MERRLVPPLDVEPYSKCPLSNPQSKQRIQILGYHISIDIKKIIYLNWQKNENELNFSIEKKRIVKKYPEKE